MLGTELCVRGWCFLGSKLVEQFASERSWQRGGATNSETYGLLTVLRALFQQHYSAGNKDCGEHEYPTDIGTRGG